MEDIKIKIILLEAEIIEINRNKNHQDQEGSLGTNNPQEEMRSKEMAMVLVEETRSRE